MTTPVDGKSFPNISANSAQFGLKVTTSVELQMLGPDGSTFVSLPTALKVTASGGTAGGYAPPGQYRFTSMRGVGTFCALEPVSSAR
jgi:hypothetical protein